MKILVDTREQLAYDFSMLDAQIERATLPSGDYSLPSFQDRVGIERKELNDLIACLMGPNRERFEKELARLARYDLGLVVVEASLEDVAQGRYRSEMKPHAALQSILSFQVRYRVPFVWAGDRKGGEYVTFWSLAKYLREIEERYKTATRGQDARRKEEANAC